MSKKKRNNWQQVTEKKPRQEMEEQKTPIGKQLKTRSGFEYKLEAKNLTDMRFLDSLVAMQDASKSESERTLATVRVIQLLLGDAQKDAFYEHVARVYGWAEPAAVGRELGDILANFDQSKKK